MYGFRSLLSEPYNAIRWPFRKVSMPLCETAFFKIFRIRIQVKYIPHARIFNFPPLGNSLFCFRDRFIEIGVQFLFHFVYIAALARIGKHISQPFFGICPFPYRSNRFSLLRVAAVLPAFRHTLQKPGSVQDRTGLLQLSSFCVCFFLTGARQKSYFGLFS